MMKFAQIEVDHEPFIIVQQGTSGWRRFHSPGRLFDLLQHGKDVTLLEAKRALAGSRTVDLSSTPMGASFGTPPSVRDFYAYEEHARAGRESRGLEMDPLWYEIPVFYFSNPYAVTGSGPVRSTPDSQRFDFEMEIAALLWGGGRDLTPEQSTDLIAGYCIMNDFSGRDIQREEMRLSLGPAKGKDTATSLGPVLVTSDEFEDALSGHAFDLEMTVSVNGEEVSSANVKDIYWSFAQMISYASRGSEVRAGDVIGSGTLNGGCLLELKSRAGGDTLPWLQPGDVVDISAGPLGTLTNEVLPPAAVMPLR